MSLKFNDSTQNQISRFYYVCTYLHYNFQWEPFEDFTDLFKLQSRIYCQKLN